MLILPDGGRLLLIAPMLAVARDLSYMLRLVPPYLTVGCSLWETPYTSEGKLPSSSPPRGVSPPLFLLSISNLSIYVLLFSYFHDLSRFVLILPGLLPWLGGRVVGFICII